METSKNKYNFDKKDSKTWYKIGETFDTVFGSLGSPYEECRAECVGLYLSTLPKIREIFGFKSDDVMYINWLHMIKSGLSGLLMYDIEEKKWGQAHCWARYVIYNVLKESNIFTINLTDKYFEINLNKDKILNEGVNVLTTFMRKIQEYKSKADIKNAKKIFYKYSEMNENILKIREILQKNKKPKSIFVQPNFYLKNNKVNLREFDISSEGIIESFMSNYNK